MKCPALLFLFLFICKSVTAQLAYPLLSEDGAWIQETFQSLDAGNESTYYTEYYLLGDTLLNGLSHKKLFIHDEYQGALREGDGYLIQSTGTSSDTLLNFSLTPGDTVRQTRCLNSESICYYLILDSIDTVRLYDGLPRARLNFTEYNSLSGLDQGDDLVLSWIDGVGSTRGLVPDPYCGFIPDRSVSPVCLERLRCVQRSGVVLYSSSGEQEYACTVPDILDSTTESEEGLNITVFPNPSTGNVTISGKQLVEVTSIDVHSPTGRLLKSIQVSAREQLNIDVERIPGLYFLVFRGPHTTFSKKFIVE